MGDPTYTWLDAYPDKLRPLRFRILIAVDDQLEEVDLNGYELLEIFQQIKRSKSTNRIYWLVQRMVDATAILVAKQGDSDVR